MGVLFFLPRRRSRYERIASPISPSQMGRTRPRGQGRK
jgi:hypothetical protein